MRPLALLPMLAVAVVGSLVSACAPPQLGGDELGRLSGRTRLAGRTYVVTGASSGFGRGVAVQLGYHGANVVLAARRAAVLEEVAAEVRAAGGQALVVPTDVSDAEAVEALASAAEARFGRIDVWVNNAAVGALGPFEAVPVADHARVVDVNLKGTMQGSHAALRRFRAQGTGVLVNVASVEGYVPVAYHASYAATKAAIIALGAALNQELRLAGADGVRVSTVLPWAVDTPFWDHAANRTGHSLRMVMMDGPDEVVDAIVWTSVHPVKEYAVGWKAKAAVVGGQIWPGLVQRLSADVLQRSQIEEAPSAPPTEGGVHRPVPQGTGVEGTTRARIAAEDAAREGR